MVKDADVVRLTRQSKLNIEFDFKRRLINPLEIAVGDGSPCLAIQRAVE